VNCDTIHRRLLALEFPDQPGEDLRQHLDACPACRAWHEQVVQLERDVLQLPAPSPVHKAAFLSGLLQDTPSSMPTPGVLTLREFRSRPPQRERGLRKMAVAVALAASLLVVAFGIWQLKQDDGSSSHRTADAEKRISRLDRHLDRDARWKAATTAKERVHILDELANDVEQKALALAEGNKREELNSQIQFYTEVIRRLTDKEAPELSQQLTPKEQSDLLQRIAERLSKVDSEATRLAMTNPESASPLQELASIAVEGRRKLRALIVI
jgi:hypothetical protein